MTNPLTAGEQAQQPQAHPLRCQTCGNREVNPNDDNYCKVIGDFIAGEIEMDTTAKVGCASHSASRQRIEQAIKELEQALQNNNRGWATYTRDHIEKALALLQQAGGSS